MLRRAPITSESPRMVCHLSSMSLSKMGSSSAKMSPSDFTLSRRKLLMAVAAGVAPRLIHAADQADQSRMIVRSPKPEDLEMPLDGFKDWITPIDRFFVRCHTYTPKVNL